MLREIFPLLLCVGVEDLLALSYLVQGRLDDVHISRVDERSHVSEEESEEKGRDVLAVDIRIGHRDVLVISNLGKIELVPHPPSNRRDQGPNPLVLQHLVHPSLLHVQDFPPQREDCLELALPALAGRTSSGRAFYDKQF